MAALTSAVVSTVRNLAEATPALAGSGPQTRRIACPDCGAPLSTAPQPGVPIRCSYCAATFTVERADDEAARVREDLRRWLDAVVAAGAAGGSVDAASRHFIFNERLLPALRLEAERYLEATELLQSSPLRAPAGRAAAPGVDVGALRRLALRLDAPEVRAFAVAPEDRFRLDELAARAALLLRLGTARTQLGQGTPAGLQAAYMNLAGASELLGTLARQAPQPQQAAFLQACAGRYQAAGWALELLARLCEPPGLAVETARQALAAARQGLDQASQALAASGYTPIEVVIAQRGVDADRAELAQLARLLDLYAALSTRGEPFPRFLQRLQAYTAHIGWTAAAPAEQAELLDRLLTWFGRQARGVAALQDWRWVDGAVESVRRHGGLFSRAETVAARTEYWHPCLCFPLRYSVAKGSVFKEGIEAAGVVLVSGVGDVAPRFVPAESPLLAALQSAVPGMPVDSLPRPLPLLSRTAARTAVERFVPTLHEVRNVRLGEPSFLLLPACVVDLQGRDGARRVQLTYCGQRQDDLDYLLGPGMNG